MYGVMADDGVHFFRKTQCLTFFWVKLHPPCALPFLSDVKLHWRWSASMTSRIVLKSWLSSLNSLAMEVSKPGKLFMDRWKSSGPITISWGTPHITFDLSKILPPPTTFSMCFCRKLPIYFNILPLTLSYWHCSPIRRIVKLWVKIFFVLHR